MLELVALADVDGWQELTPRELWKIAQVKLRSARQIGWEQTSCLLAMIHNIMSKSPKRPAEFNPMIRQTQTRRKVTVKQLGKWLGVKKKNG